MSDDFAARMRLPDPDKPSASELRIRREVRAFSWVVAALGCVLLATAATQWWSIIVYGVMTLVCLGRWQTDRPRLPGDEEPFAASVRRHPWTFGINAALAIGGGISLAMAIVHGTTAWAAAAFGALVLGAMWLTLCVARSRPSWGKRTKGTT